MFSKLLMKFKSNITLQILTGVLMVFVLLTGLVCVIGYVQFTDAIEDQYADSAYNTARTAAYELTPRFLKLNDPTLREYQMKLIDIKRNWNKLADTQDATFIYLFKAASDDVTNEYSKVTFLVNVANKRTGFPDYSAGYTITQTDSRYLRAFREIYERGSERVEIAVYRPEEKYTSGNHITVMVPVHDHLKNVIGILGVERRMEDLDDVRSLYLRHVLIFSAVFLLIVMSLYGYYLSGKLLSPIQEIASEAMRFARENTRAEIQLADKITDISEIGQLARVIDVMEENIVSYVDNLTRVTREKEQIKAELNVATQIQADMLPRKFPPFPEHDEFDIYASMTPAKEVGGDFYDFFLIDDDHMALVIADVSGKGVPAALFMVIAKTLIKNVAQMGNLSSSEILREVNTRLCENNEADLFVTVWLGILEISSGKIFASNAGHEYPAIKHVNGNFELFKTKQSPAVATMDGMKFREYDFELEAGDVLYLYTDGVAEATNSHDELFGTDRMLNALNKFENESAQEILTEMKLAVDNFTGDAPQFDDITMLCLRYFGKDSGGKKA